jgi:hypothetical protein
MVKVLQTLYKNTANLFFVVLFVQVLLSIFDVMDDTQLATKVCYLQLSVPVLSHKLYLLTDPHRKYFAGHHQRDHERPTGARLAQGMNSEQWSANFLHIFGSNYILLH